MNRIFCIILFLFLTQFACANELPYDFSDTKFIKVKLANANELSSKGEIYEGQEVRLTLKNDIICHNTLIARRGTPAKARIETIITKGMNGFPAEIIIDNFQIEGLNDGQLMDVYVKKGRNYALLVYPIKWALTPIPFVGSLTNLIMGGEAKVKKDEIITIKYFPHWK